MAQVISLKQRAYMDNANHRWNVKTGATRSGKTWLDTAYMIPHRLIERRGLPGLNVIIGNTRGTLQRNVIEPLQERFGAGRVSDIRSDNTATMFGETVYCLGADNVKHADRLRGSSIKYAYGDEVATWAQIVFEMLKSRLDKAYSRFDGTCNPEDPSHWFKAFLDSDADIYWQEYTIDDNPFLPPDVKAAMKNEYKGVFYERYILGRWVQAEGLVFPAFAEDTEPYLIDWGDSRERPGKPRPKKGMFSRIVIGVDFGGNGSKSTLCAVGYMGGYDQLIVLDEDSLPLSPNIDAAAICGRFIAFYQRVTERFGVVDWVFGDSASPTMINSLISAAKTADINWRRIAGCCKNPISQRPITVDRLLNCQRLYICRHCREVVKAISSLRWDEKKPNEPQDENIGNINDWWDAFCYTWLDFGAYIDRR